MTNPDYIGLPPTPDERSPIDPVVHTPPVAGWYDDHGRYRWWDGTQWTDHYAPIPGMRKTSHGFHLLMSIITFGLWIPVWIIVAIVNA